MNTCKHENLTGFDDHDDILECRDCGVFVMLDWSAVWRRLTGVTEHERRQATPIVSAEFVRHATPVSSSAWHHGLPGSAPPSQEVVFTTPRQSTRVATCDQCQHAMTCHGAMFGCAANWPECACTICMLPMEELFAAV